MLSPIGEEKRGDPAPLSRDRRNAAKPRPAKPINSIAQVEGSGTATTALPMPGLSTKEY